MISCGGTNELQITHFGIFALNKKTKAACLQQYFKANAFVLLIPPMELNYISHETLQLFKSWVTCKFGKQRTAFLSSDLCNTCLFSLLICVQLMLANLLTTTDMGKEGTGRAESRRKLGRKLGKGGGKSRLTDFAVVCWGQKINFPEYFN